jgi:hypothetical protein
VVVVVVVVVVVAAAVVAVMVVGGDNDVLYGVGWSTREWVRWLLATLQCASVSQSYCEWW